MSFLGITVLNTGFPFPIPTKTSEPWNVLGASLIMEGWGRGKKRIGEVSLEGRSRRSIMGVAGSLGSLVTH